MKNKINNEKTYDFGIRVNLGDKVGAGHFYRCMSIAEELDKRGHSVIFLINNKKNYLNYIKKARFPFIVIKGKNVKEELKNCIKYLDNFQRLIIDLGKDNEIYSEFFHNKRDVIVFDDLGKMKMYSNFLFNGHLATDFHNYKKINKKATIFLGPKFMPLRKEFLKNRDKYRLRKKLKKIAISFGGSDELNLTEKIASNLAKNNYEITLVIGPSYTKYDTLVSLQKKFENIKLAKQIDEIADLFTKQDLVISASGITSYELACLGIPVIFIPNNKFQDNTARVLMKNGFGINFGLWDSDYEKLNNFIHKLDYKKRNDMNCSGKQLVDGRGVNRITKIITSSD